MLNQVFAITIKEFKVLIHDRAAIVSLFIIPIAFILVMTTVLQGVFDTGSSDHPISLLAVNQDQGSIGEKVVADLRSVSGLNLIENFDGKPVTRQMAEDLIQNQTYSIAMVIPEDFSSAIQDAVVNPSASKSTISLITDPTVGGQLLSPVRGMVQGYVEREASVAQTPLWFNQRVDQITIGLPAAQADMVNEIGASFSKELSTGQSDSNLGVVYKVVSPAKFKTVREPTSAEQNVPGYTLFGVFFIMQTIATSLFREKDQGTLRRLLAAPLSQAAYLFGKLLPYYLINLIQIALMFVVGIVVFHMNLGNDFIALGLLSLTIAAVATGLGLLIASLGKTIEQVSSLGAVLSIVLAAVGGMMVPIYVMPSFMQKIALITPHAWALSGFQDVIVRGQGFETVLPTIGILIAYAFGFWGLAIWRFRMD